MPKNKRVLVLNVDCSVLCCISWQRAMCLTMQNNDAPEYGVEVMEYYDDDSVISAGGDEYPVPAIVRKTHYINKKKKVPLKKKNVYARDSYCCQYCGVALEDEKLSIDHIISRDEWRRKKMPGHPNIWTNVVTSCKPCNSKKGNKPLEKTSLKLRSIPKEPNYNQYIKARFSKLGVPEQWKKYLQ